MECLPGARSNEQEQNKIVTEKLLGDAALGFTAALKECAGPDPDVASISPVRDLEQLLAEKFKPRERGDPKAAASGSCRMIISLYGLSRSEAPTSGATVMASCDTPVCDERSALAKKDRLKQAEHCRTCQHETVERILLWATRLPDTLERTDRAVATAASNLERLQKARKELFEWTFEKANKIILPGDR